MLFSIYSAILVLIAPAVDCSNTYGIAKTEVETFCKDESLSLKEEEEGETHEEKMSRTIKPTSVDFSLLESSPNLQKIEFEGHGFDCTDERWEEFIKNAICRRVILTAQNTSCRDVQPGIETDNILHYIIDADIRNCQAESKCRMTRNHLFVDVDCDKHMMSDSDLPSKLPFMTKKLFLSQNKLTDISSWLKDILRKLMFLCLIDIQHNMIQELPYIPQSSNPLVQIYFDGNRITKLDVEMMRSYLYYEKLVLSIKDNPLICDCDIEEFVAFLRKHPARVDDYSSLFCQDKEQLIRPWMYNNVECKNSSNVFSNVAKSLIYNLDIVFLLIINVVLIVILIDIHRALKDVRNPGKRDQRAPWIHHVVVKIQEYAADFWKFIMLFKFPEYRICS